MTAPSAAERFTIALDVASDDIDELGHVNNVVYVRWIQEVAVAHWAALTTPQEKAAVVWVVVRHEIDYQQAARPGDRILARTWVGRATRHTFERHTEILRDGDQRLLARGRTVWCPLDPGTGRPIQVSPGIRARFSVSEPAAD